MENVSERPLRRGLILAAAIINYAIFLTFWIVFINGITTVQDGALAVKSLRSLKYFTVLSNLLESVAAHIMGMELISVLKGRKQEPGLKVRRLKLASTAAVAVTFIVVAVFLGPIYGYPTMFRGANLWFHLIVPLAAIFEYIFCEYLNRPAFRDTFWCAAVVFIYGLFYVGNILVNGVGEWPNRNDFYGFLLWGVPIGIVLLLAVVLIGWLAGILLRKANLAFARRLEGRSKKAE